MASYRVTLKRSAEKELFKLPNKECARITEKLKKLAEVPLPAGVEKLAGYSDRYRIRQGDYRILYRVDHSARQVFVFKIGHRREVYRQ